MQNRKIKAACTSPTRVFNFRVQMLVSGFKGEPQTGEESHRRPLQNSSHSYRAQLMKIERLRAGKGDSHSSYFPFESRAERQKSKKSRQTCLTQTSYRWIKYSIWATYWRKYCALIWFQQCDFGLSKSIQNSDESGLREIYRM